MTQDDIKRVRGKKTASAQTDSDAFKNWFGNSKVVDAEGKPLVVFHGTPNTFKVFDSAYSGSSSDTGMWGDGFYFTTDPKYAESYSKRGDTQGAIMPIYLSIQNPYVIKNKQDIPDIKVPAETEEDLNNGPKNYSRMFREFIKDNGYDGVIVYDFNNLDNIDELVVFNPSQIKSASGNNGAFSMDSADITAAIKTAAYFTAFWITPEGEEVSVPHNHKETAIAKGWLPTGEDYEIMTAQDIIDTLIDLGFVRILTLNNNTVAEFTEAAPERAKAVAFGMIRAALDMSYSAGILYNHQKYFTVNNRMELASAIRSMGISPETIMPMASKKTAAALFYGYIDADGNKHYTRDHVGYAFDNYKEFLDAAGYTRDKMGLNPEQVYDIMYSHGFARGLNNGYDQALGCTSNVTSSAFDTVLDLIKTNLGECTTLLEVDKKSYTIDDKSTMGKVMREVRPMISSASKKVMACYNAERIGDYSMFWDITLSGNVIYLEVSKPILDTEDILCVEIEKVADYIAMACSGQLNTGDTFEACYIKSRDVIREAIELWKTMPVADGNPKSAAAKDLNIAILTGNWTNALNVLEMLSNDIVNNNAKNTPASEDAIKAAQYKTTTKEYEDEICPHCNEVIGEKEMYWPEEYRNQPASAGMTMQHGCGGLIHYPQTQEDRQILKDFGFAHIDGKKKDKTNPKVTEYDGLPIKYVADAAYFRDEYWWMRYGNYDKMNETFIGYGADPDNVSAYMDNGFDNVVAESGIDRATLERVSAHYATELGLSERQSTAGKKTTADMWDDEADGDNYREMLDVMGDAVQSVIAEYATGNPQEFASPFPAPRLKKIYSDFVATGFVRDDAGIKKLKEIIFENTKRLYGNSILVGDDWSDHSEEFSDMGLSEEDVEKVIDWIGPTNHSEFGMQPLLTAVASVMSESDTTKTFIAIDHVFNIAHTRSDLAALFVEGGTTTLDEIAGRPSANEKLDAEAAKKTAAKKTVDTSADSAPFEYQDNNQEVVIHSGWSKGNNYRYVLEGAGDIKTASKKTAVMDILPKDIFDVQEYKKAAQKLPSPFTYPKKGSHSDFISKEDATIASKDNTYLGDVFKIGSSSILAALNHTAEDRSALDEQLRQAKKEQDILQRQFNSLNNCKGKSVNLSSLYSDLLKAQKHYQSLLEQELRLD